MKSPCLPLCFHRGRIMSPPRCLGNTKKARIAWKRGNLEAQGKRGGERVCEIEKVSSSFLKRAYLISSESMGCGFRHRHCSFCYIFALSLYPTQSLRCRNVLYDIRKIMTKWEAVYIANSPSSGIPWHDSVYQRRSAHSGQLYVWGSDSCMETLSFLESFSTLVVIATPRAVNVSGNGFRGRVSRRE